ncbi:hypothetical protein GSI_07925 [Ganoderma sinense ZZ0214-1]|uniref:F-box domain-containing protein n=1 Tax=Ganoderma sinense ZZ0214-1 TaxID=1077348 RepID=A0A2G8S8E7_9APHY|nr:hypothetical protein GSI_07925 [Ganoderma sinense ZZ0214-1]
MDPAAGISYLMNALEVPRLVFLDLHWHLSEWTPSSTPFLLDALAPRPMPHLALDVSPGFAEFDVMLHGCNVSLFMTLRSVQFGVPDEDRTDWAFTGLPTVLPLSGVEESHILTYQWDTPPGFLSHLATYMPAVSTLLIKYDLISGEEDVDGHMELARVLSRVLESDSPVLFPRLAHLELVVGTIPLAFCEIIARALARRHEDGRRLRKLRICIDHQLFLQ